MFASQTWKLTLLLPQTISRPSPGRVMINQTAEKQQQWLAHIKIKGTQIVKDHFLSGLRLLLFLREGSKNQSLLFLWRDRDSRFFLLTHSSLWWRCSSSPRNSFQLQRQCQSKCALYSFVSWVSLPSLGFDYFPSVFSTCIIIMLSSHFSQSSLLFPSVFIVWLHCHSAKCTVDIE